MWKKLIISYSGRKIFELKIQIFFRKTNTFILFSLPSFLCRSTYLHRVNSVIVIVQPFLKYCFLNSETYFNYMLHGSCLIVLQCSFTVISLYFTLVFVYIQVLMCCPNWLQTQNPLNFYMLELLTILQDLLVLLVHNILYFHEVLFLWNDVLIYTYTRHWSNKCNKYTDYQKYFSDLSMKKLRIFHSNWDT